MMRTRGPAAQREAGRRTFSIAQLHGADTTAHCSDGGEDRTMYSNRFGPHKNSKPAPGFPHFFDYLVCFYPFVRPSTTSTP